MESAPETAKKPEDWHNPFLERIKTFQETYGRDPGAEDLWDIFCSFPEEDRASVFGRMYFLRHGETVANEQNAFAGRNETNLSELGFEQARKGGKNMASRGLVFDEVHISPLMRTYETAITILEQLQQKSVRVFVSDQVVERDFGFYSRFNKNLMCKAAGYRAYEESLHSVSGFPPGGETFMEMYRRTLEYFRETLIPRVAEGKKILVVCHKYIVEMFGMIVAGKEVDQYHDMRLPNAYAMSGLELRTYALADSKVQKELADRTIFLGPVLFFVAALAGAGLKVLLPAVQLPKTALLLSLGALLAVSSFFVMLSIHTGVVLDTIKSPRDLFSRKYVPWFFRIGLIMAIVFVLDDLRRECIWLLAAMPPALTAPVLSILWGGNLYMAIRVTVLLSCLLPFAMPLLFHGAGVGSASVLLPFTMTLVFSIFLPTGLAQFFRARNPIQAGKTSTRWKWLSVVAVAFICFLGAFYFTPPDLLSMQAHRLLSFQKQGLAVLGIFVLMKGFAFFNLFYTQEEAPERTDLFITQSTPNIFLWLSIISMLPEAGQLGFWGCLFFAGSILFDEAYFVRTFRKNLQMELCRQAENFWQYKRYRRKTPRPAAMPPADGTPAPPTAAPATAAGTAAGPWLPPAAASLRPPAEAPPTWQVAPQDAILPQARMFPPWKRALWLTVAFAILAMALYFSLQPPPPPHPLSGAEALQQSATTEKKTVQPAEPGKIPTAPPPAPAGREPAAPLPSISTQTATPPPPAPVPNVLPASTAPAPAALSSTGTTPAGVSSASSPVPIQTQAAPSIPAPPPPVPEAVSPPEPTAPSSPPSPPIAGSQQALTPPVAVPQAPTQPAPQPAVSAEEEVRSFLSAWTTAWERAAGPDGDVDGYMNLYSDTFTAGKFDKAGWRKDKLPKLRKSEWVRIGTDSVTIRILTPGQTVEVRFTQRFESPRFQDSGKKILVVGREAGGWRVLSERAE